MEMRPASQKLPWAPCSFWELWHENDLSNTLMLGGATEFYVRMRWKAKVNKRKLDGEMVDIGQHSFFVRGLTFGIATTPCCSI
jgi:hypothetical protein